MQFITRLLNRLRFLEPPLVLEDVRVFLLFILETHYRTYVCSGYVDSLDLGVRIDFIRTNTALHHVTGLGFVLLALAGDAPAPKVIYLGKIGRASCRERV